MKKHLAALLLLTAAPALALEQDAGITPLPGLAARPTPTDFQAGKDWIAGGAPALFTIGTAKTPGMQDEETLVIAQRGAAGRQTGNVGRRIAADGFRGQRVRLSARLKAQAVGRLQLWLTAQRPAGAMLTYDMAEQPIHGTADWKRYEIVMDVPADAIGLSYGFLVGGGDHRADGKGVAFGESFTLEAVGREVPVTRAHLAADYTPPVRHPIWDNGGWAANDGWGRVNRNFPAR